MHVKVFPCGKFRPNPMRPRKITRRLAVLVATVVFTGVNAKKKIGLLRSE
jgi:hypothetical protein